MPTKATCLNRSREEQEDLPCFRMNAVDRLPSFLYSVIPEWDRAWLSFLRAQPRLLQASCSDLGNLPETSLLKSSPGIEYESFYPWRLPWARLPEARV